VKNVLDGQLLSLGVIAMHRPWHEVKSQSLSLGESRLQEALDAVRCLSAADHPDNRNDLLPCIDDGQGVQRELQGTVQDELIWWYC
jgi:hypothetical protein